MSRKISLNADLGESFGRYVLGNDAELMKVITTANIACGYHAGDSRTMNESVMLAKNTNVDIGAHIGFPDLVGFGRRYMKLSPNEIYEITVHQIGSLSGFCKVNNVKICHVKPHGQLFMAAQNESESAHAMVNAIGDVDSSLILLMEGEIPALACKSKGIRFVEEGYIDLDYDDDGMLVIEKEKKERDPEAIARIAIDLVNQQGRKTLSGRWKDIPVKSVCVHGDGPNALQIAHAVRNGLESADIEIVSLRQL